MSRFSISCGYLAFISLHNRKIIKFQRSYEQGGKGYSIIKTERKVGFLFDLYMLSVLFLPYF